MTKERLRNYRFLRKELTQIDDQIRELRAEMTSPKSQQLTGMPGGGHRNDSPTESYIVRLCALEDLYARKRAAIADEMRAVEEALEPLESIERQLMRARYLDGLRWEEVCVVIGYSWQQTHRIHAAALRKVCAE